MQRHISMRGTLISEDRVMIELLSQSHMGREFYPPNSEYNGEWFCFNYDHTHRVWLGSLICTDVSSLPWDTNGKYGYVYLNAKEQTFKSFTCSLRWWKALKAAVNAYNEWGASYEG